MIGRSTQIARITHDYDIVPIYMDACCDHEIAHHTRVGRQIKEMRAQGEIVSVSILLPLLQHEMERGMRRGSAHFIVHGMDDMRMYGMYEMYQHVIMSYHGKSHQCMMSL